MAAAKPQASGGASGLSRLASGAGSRWIGTMAITGSFAAVRAQAPQTAGFSAAFSYVEDLLREDSPARARLRAIAPGASGRIELAGGAYAIEQVFATRPRAEGFFESHRKYIDVQVVVEGEEAMEIVDVTRIAVKEPYSAERDVILYADVAGASEIRLAAGDATVFFPVDVHMPCLQARPTGGLVRKTVVKVPVG
jgi:YhcH/YjgK/YiaL family protein